jgi:hypothetical protein
MVRASQARVHAIGGLSMKLITSDAWVQHMQLVSGRNDPGFIIHDYSAVRADILEFGNWVRLLAIFRRGGAEVTCGDGTLSGAWEVMQMSVRAHQFCV